MNEALIIDVAREAIMQTILVSAPMLMIALIVGLLISIFQTVTSIQEQTLAFVPKIIAVFISILVFGPWMLNQMVELINKLYTSFSIFIFS
ncbi:MAG: flagellar biosynthetic protein FliQ [Firmicutes bacterium HGW-Firmicutes-7]|nr:MAG: flagellar biosynthetic protein FliQ [Firmicutes bacterium HGW-Firmicutes-7]